MRFRQTILLFALILCGSIVFAQKSKGSRNLQQFDRKPYHFGFLLSTNTSSFFVDYKPDFTFNDSLLRIDNVPQSGFNLALLASYNLTKNVNFRFIPGLSFQDRGLEYTFLREDAKTETLLKIVQSVWLEFPVVIKLRTNRVGNFAAYALIGGKYGLDMQSQKDVNNAVAGDIIVKLKDRDYSIDAGAGFDFFLPYFKFAIEFKTAFGLNNVLLEEDHPFAAPIESLRTRTFVVSFTFEG
jgi:hypothetical protein